MSQKMDVFKEIARTGRRLEHPAEPGAPSADELRFIRDSMRLAKSDALIEASEPVLAASILKRRAVRDAEEGIGSDRLPPAGLLPEAKGSWLSRVIGRLRGKR